MSKRWEREERIIDRLNIENKKLKSENKTLRRKLRELSKGYYRFMVAEDEAQEKEAAEQAKEVAQKLCYECHGEYKEIIVVNRRFRQCQDCGKRGKVTILK